MRYGEIARKIREETRIIESSAARLNALADELEHIENATPKLDKAPEFVQSEYIPSKLLISVPEAARYFGIGETRLYRIIAEHPGADFILEIGSHVKIKRVLFERYLDAASCV